MSRVKRGGFLIMAVTPEQVPQYHHIPVLDVKGGLKWVGHHWRSVSIALAGGASLAYGAYQLIRPYTPDTQVTDNNAPITDTAKSFEGGGPENPNVVISPGFPGKEPSATPKPPENPVDTAIKAGVIKAETPQDFTKFFAPITKEQIAAEIAKAQEQGQIEVLMPIKKKGSGGLELKNFRTKGLTAKTDVQERTELGINGIEPGDEYVAPISGTALLYHASFGDFGSYVMVHIKNELTEVVYVVKDPKAKEAFQNSTPTPVTAGDTMFTATAPGVFPDGNFGGYQGAMWVKKGETWVQTSLADLVTYQGKIGQKA